MGAGKKGLSEGVAHELRPKLQEGMRHEKMWETVSRAGEQPVPRP